MQRNGLMGLALLAPEGINATVAGAEGPIESFKVLIRGVLGNDEIRFKDSVSQIPPFKRVTVDIRTEIVGLKRPDLTPNATEDHHLSAREWHEMLGSDEPKIVIDTRNGYETSLGMFHGAIDPSLDRFSDWSGYLDKEPLPTDQPILIYCTGGIRCEKAILDMRAHGFERVYQLRDGILGYLAEYPDGQFEGECFVFDDRVSLGSDLLPTGNFGICPGCGLTSGAKKACSWCGEAYFVCPRCEPTWDPVCSKTCLDRWSRHGSKEPRKLKQVKTGGDN